MVPTFCNVYKIPLISMSISGTHPEILRDFKWFLRFFCILSMYLGYHLVFDYNIFYLNMRDHDFGKVCKNGVLTLVVTCGTFQYATLFWKRKHILILFKSVESDYFKTQTLSTKYQSIVTFYTNKSILVSKIWLAVVIAASLTFPLKNIILHIYYYCISDFRWIHLYDLEYPKKLNDVKDHPVVFWSLYGVETFLLIYGATIYCSFSPLGPNFVLHACGQLEILIKRIEDLFSQEFSEKDIMNELKEVAIELQNIYSFVNEIQEAFGIAYEIVLKTTTYALPIAVYEFIEAYGAGDFSVEFVTYVVGSAVLSSSLCYFGELLKEKDEMFRLALYSCGWERCYHCPTRIMILLLLLRVTRPIAIRTIFKTLCLETLADVYRQSYALFSLMNAMWN